MSCDRRVFGLTVTTAPYVPLSCCPDDTDPGTDPGTDHGTDPGTGPGDGNPDTNPGTIDPSAGGIIVEGDNIPQPNPQPDPPIRTRRRILLSRPNFAPVPSFRNNWRWRNRTIGGVTNPGNTGPISTGGTLTPGGGMTEEPR